MQLVRRKDSPSGGQEETSLAPSTRENFLSAALLAILSLNMFLLSSVLSFCLFVFWYPH